MKPLAEQTLYEVLEVAPSATYAEIRESYERLRRLLGPGSLAVYALVDPAEAQAHVLRIDEAWAVLSDAAERHRYDASIGLAPPAEAPPQRATFADALAAIGRAGSGAEAPPVEPEEEPEPIALDEDDLLEVVEIAGAGIVVAQPLALEEPRRGRVLEAVAEEEPGDVAEEEILAAEEIGAEPEEVEPAPEPLVEAPAFPTLGPDTVYAGALLRQVRRARGLSLDEVARRTRIHAAHFANIEEERWADLPERVFLRGYLTAYARELRLDPAQVCASYLARRPTSGSR